MIRAAYSLATWLAQPLLLRKLRRRGVAEPGYLHAVDERFGRYTTALPDADAVADADSAAGRPLVWVHAVSLGETRAAAILLTALRQRLPGMRLLLTNGTATGRAEGQKLLQPGDVQVWQPWDSAGAVRRFLRHFRPDVGVLMETEIWPNLTAACAAHGVPLALANARLSDKSLRGALRARWLMQPAYAALRAVWAQTEADAARLRAAGAPQVSVLGNLKFDATPNAAQQAQAAEWRARLGGRQIVMLASSREGEEAQFLESIWPSAPQPPAQAAIKNDGEARPLWLIVPRHPQRFDEVAALAAARGLRVARRSSWGDLSPAEAALADIWIGDSLGEMSLYYSLADVALLGGSFEPLGGQNLIEAAACGCPVLMGPHTFNFAQAAEWAEAQGAAQRVPDMAAAVAAARALLADGTARGAMQAAGRQFAAAHRGAAARTADAIAQLLAQRTEGAEEVMKATEATEAAALSTAITQVRGWLQDAEHIAMLTGAGVSAESGVPTFRDAQSGLWARFRPEDLATEAAFRAHPQRVWDWYAARRDKLRTVQPNAGHVAVAQFQARHPGQLTLVTQNVDGLHQAAGSPGVLALHGNLFDDAWLDDCAMARRPDDACPVARAQPGRPPSCAQCGNLVRPAIVWFGENLPADALAAAESAAQRCDVMLVVGTSGQVWPAAGLAAMARRAGAKVVVINPDDTALDSEAHALLRGPSARVLPRLLDF